VKVRQNTLGDWVILTGSHYVFKPRVTDGFFTRKKKERLQNYTTQNKTNNYRKRHNITQIIIINQQIAMNTTTNVEKPSHTTQSAKLMCSFCGETICLMNSSVGLNLVTSSIRDGLNNYKLHISKSKKKGADNASVQMAPCIIRHFIVQAYARESKLMGFNIVTNIPGCILIKIHQNLPNKIGFYKD
jgi:hypothetical protein